MLNDSINKNFVKEKYKEYFIIDMSKIYRLILQVI